MASSSNNEGEKKPKSVRKTPARKAKQPKVVDEKEVVITTKSSKRKKKVTKEKESKEIVTSTKKKKEVKKKETPKKRKRTTTNDVSSSTTNKKVKTDNKETPKKKVKGVKKPKSKNVDDDISTTSSSKKDTTKKKKKKDHQRLTERDILPKLWNNDDDSSSYTLRICSWNVAGLRAVLRNHPDTLPNLVKEYNIDILCLQETKLQELHLDDPKLQIRQALEGYDSYWSCSTAKKGYSGTAVFVKKRRSQEEETSEKNDDDTKGDDNEVEDSSKTTANDNANPLLLDKDFVKNLLPTDVSYKMGITEHDSEGRLVIADFPLFTLINCYVPNSGQKLERLEYRTEKWDKDLLAFAESKRTKNPVLWLGDLNVAHTNLEVWNDGAKHLPKQAGVTPQERASFQSQLDENGYIDAFRQLHPTAQGCYSYWSQRAGNREPNKGLRLDYFICSPELFDDDEAKVIARDSYALHNVVGSDHCPVVLELQIKK